MNYYCLKIGKGNKLAKDWLSGKNPLHKPAAVIFFGHTKVNDLLRNKYPKKKQAIEFCKSGWPSDRKNTTAVVISSGELWLVRPKSRVRDLKREKHNIPKAMEIKVLKRKKLTDIPAVLANISTNRYLSSGTFREIDKTKYRGKIKAIRAVLGKSLSRSDRRKKHLNATDLFDCLSSVELETLVSKLFENKGCFVPAYRGGYLKDIDIFARNDSTKSINLDGISIAPKQTISIQVKTKIGKKEPIVADYFIALDTHKDDKSFDANWLLKQVKNSSSTKSWLLKSLSWLPKDFLKHYF